MSPAEKLASLEPGDRVLGGPLLGREGRGLTDDVVEVVATSKSQAGAVTLQLEFMGIKLAKAAGKVGENGKIIWWEAKE